MPGNGYTSGHYTQGSNYGGYNQPFSHNGFDPYNVQSNAEEMPEELANITSTADAVYYIRSGAESLKSRFLPGSYNVYCSQSCLPELSQLINNIETFRYRILNILGPNVQPEKGPVYALDNEVEAHQASITTTTVPVTTTTTEAPATTLPPIPEFPTEGNNLCFQDLVINLKTIDDTEDFIRCQSCYIDCFKNAPQVSDLDGVEALKAWMNPESDDSCGEPCNSEHVTCMGRKSLMVKYFGSLSSENNEFRPNYEFKSCITKMTPKSVIEDAFQNTEAEETYIESFRDYFMNPEDPSVKAYKLFLDAKEQSGKPTNMFNDKYTEEDYPEDGNNKCIQNLLNHVEQADLNRGDDRIRAGTDTWETCKPCYQDCLSSAADISSLNSIEELKEWLNPEDPRCAMGCDVTCEVFGNIIPLLQANPYHDKAFRECWTLGTSSVSLALQMYLDEELNKYVLEPITFPQYWDGLVPNSWLEVMQTQAKRAMDEKNEVIDFQNDYWKNPGNIVQYFRSKTPETAPNSWHPMRNMTLVDPAWQNIFNFNVGTIQVPAFGMGMAFGGSFFSMFGKKRRRKRSEESTAPSNPENPLVEPLVGFYYPTEGNNRCIRSVFQEYYPEYLYYPASEQQDSQNFLNCLPCYLDCMAQARDLSSATSWEDFENILFTDPHGEGASCTKTCSGNNACKDYPQLWKIYLSRNTKGYGFDEGATPSEMARNINFIYPIKICIKDQMKFLDKSSLSEIVTHPLYTKYSYPSLLSYAFDRSFDKEYRSSNELTCRPCYTECIRKRVVYTMDTFDEFWKLIVPNEDDEECNTFRGQTCEGNCMNFRELMNTYMLRDRYPSEGLGEKLPKSHAVSEAIRTEASDSLRQSFSDNGFEKEEIDRYVSDNWINRRNDCFQDLIVSGTEKLTSEVIFPTSYDPFNAYHNTCDFCYERCFGEYAPEFTHITSYEFFLEWFIHGPDTYDTQTDSYLKSCSDQCSTWSNHWHGKDCMNWYNMMNTLFIDPDTQCATDGMRRCLTESAQDTLKEAFLTKTDISTYQCFFDELPLPYRQDADDEDSENNSSNVDLDNIDIENPLNLPREVVATAGNNLCFQTDMMNLDFSNIQLPNEINQFNVHEYEDEKQQWQICHPCYIQCMRDANAVMDFTTLDQLENWVMPPHNNYCASHCDRNCEDWSTMLRMYFNIKGSGHEFKPNLNFRACMSKEASRLEDQVQAFLHKHDYSYWCWGHFIIYYCESKN